MGLQECSSKWDRQQEVSPLDPRSSPLAGMHVRWLEFQQPDCDREDRHHTLSLSKQKETRALPTSLLTAHLVASFT